MNREIAEKAAQRRKDEMTSSEILLFVKEEVAKYDDGKPSSLVIQAIREACLNLVSSKAAEAPGGQDELRQMLVKFRDILRKKRFGLTPEGADEAADRVDDFIEKIDELAAPAAPSERADDANAAMGWAANRYLQDYGAKGGPAQVTMGVIRRCERLAFFAGWQARAGLSSQEGVK